MNIFVDTFTQPKGFQTDSFVVFPTDTSLFQSDYETVMKCRNSLRLWSQSNWPEDSFTADQNRQDLQLHVDDNVAHTTYGYMIYSANRKQCYGSIYVSPVDSILESYDLTKDESQKIAQFDARVDFWTNSECGEPDSIAGLETLLVNSLVKWFAAEWKIKPGFCARRGMNERVQVYKIAGMNLVADAAKVDTDGSVTTLLVFG